MNDASQATPQPTSTGRLLLDHLVVIAPNLTEGVVHVRHCLDVDVPLGQVHTYMGTHNRLLQLGNSVYLEIVALDPDGQKPAHARWFGLDDQARVRADWDVGRRLRSWVARTDAIDLVLTGREPVLGTKVALPRQAPLFDFALLEDGSLPLDGAVPLIIDRRGQQKAMAMVADLGARLRSFSLQHPEAARIADLYEGLVIDRPPMVIQGSDLRYRAHIDTPAGPRELY